MKVKDRSRNVIGYLKQFNDLGQGLMEYMILTGLVSILCLLAVRTFGEGVKSKMQQATEKINKTIVIR